MRKVLANGHWIFFFSHWNICFSTVPRKCLFQAVPLRSAPAIFVAAPSHYLRCFCHHICSRRPVVRRKLISSFSTNISPLPPLLPHPTPAGRKPRYFIPTHLTIQLSSLILFSMYSFSAYFMNGQSAMNYFLLFFTLFLIFCLVILLFKKTIFS